MIAQWLPQVDSHCCSTFHVVIIATLFNVYFSKTFLYNNFSANFGSEILLSSSDPNFGEGPGNPFQYSCLEYRMDKRAWWATVHGVAKSWT